MRSLVPRGVESALLQHVLLGFLVMIIGGLPIVVVMLRVELHKDTMESVELSGEESIPH